MAFFSIIIPCHNSNKTIARLLDSLTKQGIGKKDLQVILCDDASDDGWQECMAKYEKKLDIIYHEVKGYKHHCPGNTRLAGLELATGEWICFADHDDMLERHALKKVKKYIAKTGEKNCLCTNMRSWNEKSNIFTPFLHKQAWLHGKFYNREFLKKNRITFKAELTTHEDIYFNSCVLSALYSVGIMDFTYYDIFTYRWIEEPTSITRGYKGERGYLHENFDDYIACASEPFWEGACLKSGVHINQVMMTLLHAYFYYEAVSYLYGREDYKDNFISIRRFFKKIQLELHVSTDDVINFVYKDPVKFFLVREECRISEGFFIEKTSFRDFINHISQMPTP